MSNHKKKKIAPIVISVLLIIYYVLYFLLLVALIDILALKLLLGIIPLLISGIIIYVCVERIKEIDKGEEDDLSKY